MFIDKFKVESPNVKYGETEIESVYNCETTELTHEVRDGSYQWVVKPKTVQYHFKTDLHVPKIGVMLVGWGGNNGSTLTTGVIANREGISWATKDKVQQVNYFGSLTQASTFRVGSFNGEEIYAPFKSLLSMRERTKGTPTWVLDKGTHMGLPTLERKQLWYHYRKLPEYDSVCWQCLLGLHLV